MRDRIAGALVRVAAWLVTGERALLTRRVTWYTRGAAFILTRREPPCAKP